MRIKKGVRLHGIRPEIMIAMMITDSVYLTFGEELVVTSVSDGSHSERSRHYLGDAFDGRTRYFTDDEQEKLAVKLQEELGQDFIVILESNHIHIQYSPKRLN